jgi:hypothetical protein
MIHNSGEVGVRECYFTEGFFSQNVAGRGLPIFTEKEARLRIQIRVAPAVQNNSSHVPARIESGARKHVGKLLADLPLVPPKGCS